MLVWKYATPPQKKKYVLLYQSLSSYDLHIPIAGGRSTGSLLWLWENAPAGDDFPATFDGWHQRGNLVGGLEPWNCKFSPIVGMMIQTDELIFFWGLKPPTIGNLFVSHDCPDILLSSHSYPIFHGYVK